MYFDWLPELHVIGIKFEEGDEEYDDIIGFNNLVEYLIDHPEWHDKGQKEIIDEFHYRDTYLSKYKCTRFNTYSNDFMKKYFDYYFYLREDKENNELSPIIPYASAFGLRYFSVIFEQMKKEAITVPSLSFMYSFIVYVNNDYCYKNNNWKGCNDSYYREVFTNHVRKYLKPLPVDKYLIPNNYKYLYIKSDMKKSTKNEIVVADGIIKTTDQFIKLFDSIPESYHNSIKDYYKDYAIPLNCLIPYMQYIHPESVRKISYTPSHFVDADLYKPSDYINAYKTLVNIIQTQERYLDKIKKEKEEEIDLVNNLKESEKTMQREVESTINDFEERINTQIIGLQNNFENLKQNQELAIDLAKNEINKQIIDLQDKINNQENEQEIGLSDSNINVLICSAFIATMGFFMYFVAK